MNNNNNIVTSVQTSEKLSDVLTEKIESTFYWALSSQGWILLYALHNGFVDHFGNFRRRDEFETFYEAYTVTELNEMLPSIIGTDSLYSLQYSRTWSKDDMPEHELSYWFAGKDYLVQKFHDTLVEVYASVVIELKSKNIKLAHERHNRT